MTLSNRSDRVCAETSVWQRSLTNPLRDPQHIPDPSVLQQVGIHLSYTHVAIYVCLRAVFKIDGDGLELSLCQLSVKMNTSMPRMLSWIQ